MLRAKVTAKGCQGQGSVSVLVHSTSKKGSHSKEKEADSPACLPPGVAKKNAINTQKNGKEFAKIDPPPSDPPDL